MYPGLEDDTPYRLDGSAFGAFITFATIALSLMPLGYSYFTWDSLPQVLSESASDIIRAYLPINLGVQCGTFSLCLWLIYETGRGIEGGWEDGVGCFRYGGRYLLKVT